MTRQFFIGDRLPEEFEDLGERLIQVDLLRLVQVPRFPGEDEAKDRIVRHARDVIVPRVHRASFRLSAALIPV